MTPSFISDFTLVSALGAQKSETLQALKSNQHGLEKTNLSPQGSTYFGRAQTKVDMMPKKFENFANSACRLLFYSLSQDNIKKKIDNLICKFGAHRVGCLVGTITGAFSHIEKLYQQDIKISNKINIYNSGSINTPMNFIRAYTGITGPHGTVSTACSSSAKIFAVGHNYLQAGLCDAVVLVGIEPYCETILYGFRALSVLSAKICEPFGDNRDGINIGSAAGIALLTREPESPNDILLCGFGENSDGYHMTAPHPDGLGIAQCMKQALEKASLNKKDINYINAHGSGTQLNDISEARAIYKVFGDQVLVSSTKGLTGHTQGACGITEAIVCFHALQEKIIPANSCANIDAKINCNINKKVTNEKINYVLSNSMGFGGNNISLIFGAPR